MKLFHRHKWRHVAVREWGGNGVLLYSRCDTCGLRREKRVEVLGSIEQVAWLFGCPAIKREEAIKEAP